MDKFITTIAIAALASTAVITGVSAMPGKNGGGQTMAQQFGGFQSPQFGGLGGFTIKTNAGGDSTSPGDAFYPDGAVGDPKRACLFAGGTPKRVADGWLCL